MAPERLRELYRLMLLTRRLDEEAVALQRQGVLTAFPPLTGQEAAQCASALAAEPGDFIFPSYRELGVAVTRGVDLVGYLVAYRGFWNGGRYDPIASGFAPIASSVGSHALHAVGWAMGARLDGKPNAALAYFGEGATSEGDVHEAMNFAGVFTSPVVFFVQNNQWAISVPVEKQTAAPIFKKAEAYGFAGVRVDGNDAEAVYDATDQALTRARQGGGPTLIEALTYRVGPHSTADDPSRYRTTAERERWQAKDPLDRLRPKLDPTWLDQTERDVRVQVTQIREAVAAAQPPRGEEIFEVVYAAPPTGVEAQMREWQAAADA